MKEWDKYDDYQPTNCNRCGDALPPESPPCCAKCIKQITGPAKPRQVPDMRNWEAVLPEYSTKEIDLELSPDEEDDGECLIEAPAKRYFRNIRSIRRLQNPPHHQATL